MTLEVPAGTIGSDTTFSIDAGSQTSEFGAGSAATNLVTIANLKPHGMTFSPPGTNTKWTYIGPKTGAPGGLTKVVLRACCEATYPPTPSGPGCVSAGGGATIKCK